MKHTTILPALLLGLTAVSAQADTYNASTVSYTDANGSGSASAGLFPSTGITSPGQISWTFTSSSAGQGTFGFQIAGYLSLDGNNCCTDSLSVLVNGNEVFAGAFSLGGGGNNVVTNNPSNASWQSSAPENSTTWNGGLLDVSGILIALNQGSNTIDFIYSGDYQGLGDEGWALNSANVITTVPVPGAAWLFGTAFLSLLGLNHRKTA